MPIETVSYSTTVKKCSAAALLPTFEIAKLSYLKGNYLRSRVKRLSFTVDVTLKLFWDKTVF